jgi:murein DD-endopeptidase MepM/ murein hydrolase activator NlpD
MTRRLLLAFTALTLVAAATPAAANPEHPLAADARLADGTDGVTIALTLNPGESLDRLFARVGVPEGQRHAALSALQAVTPARGPHTGDRIGLAIVRSAAGTADLNAVYLETGANSDLTLVASNEQTTPGSRRPERARRTVRGTAGSDFSATLADIGVPVSVIDDAAEALSFAPDIAGGAPEPGTRFHIVYRAAFGDDEPRLERITLNGPDGREHRIVSYAAPRATVAFLEPPEAPPQQRDPATLPTPTAYERPATLSFAKSYNAPSLAIDSRLPKGEPVPGGRLTSPFGWRIHPVLHRPQFHKGVDYSAPAGTPVLATADGMVSFVGKRGNYGKLIRVQHAGDVVTAYAHLQDFAGGIKPGTRVRQGQVIGHVGRSGLATGNHLYYEVYADGKQVDPLGGVIVQKHMSEAEIKRLRRALAKDGMIVD